MLAARDTGGGKAIMFRFIWKPTFGQHDVVSPLWVRRRIPIRVGRTVLHGLQESTLSACHLKLDLMAGSFGINPVNFVVEIE
jgi:hypothetical protein